MTTTEMRADTSANRTGVYLALLQLVFTLGWTTYVIYLPKLAASVGIAPSAVILILMLDQAIFTITDTAMGIVADKIAPFVGRLGVFVGTLTALSCAAFVALPFVAGTGPGAQPWFIGLIVIWSITSSALRAPPLTLLGKHRAKPSVPFLSALAMLGYGVAGAVSVWSVGKPLQHDYSDTNADGTDHSTSNALQRDKEGGGTDTADHDAAQQGQNASGQVSGQVGGFDNQVSAGQRADGKQSSNEARPQGNQDCNSRV